MWVSLREEVEELFGNLEGCSTRWVRAKSGFNVDYEAERKDARTEAGLARPANPCRHCGKAILDSFKPGRRKEFCDVNCKTAAFYWRKKRKEEPAMAEIGLEYEPKPAWVECSKCGARRPPGELEAGVCRTWGTFQDDGHGVARYVNRCSELAASKATP